MLKFWSVLVGMPLLLVGAGVGTYSYLSRRAAPVVVAAPTVHTGPETEKESHHPALCPIRWKRRPATPRKRRPHPEGRHPDDGCHRKSRYLPILTKILRSDEPELRSAAADAMGMIRPTQRKPRVARLLKDPVAGVAEAARRALAESSDSAARDLARNVQSARKQAPDAP